MPKDSMQPSQDITVVFITGSSRSGTTLLDRILGQVPGFFSLGEMFYIWERGYLRNELCGCGKPFKDCEFWRNVTDEAFRDIYEMDFQEILRLQRDVTRIRHLPLFLFPQLRPQNFQHQLDAYIAILVRLYKAIARVSGCNILIDSSKFAPHGFILREMLHSHLYVIHLVRDSRAVVYSLQRKRVRPEIYWKEEYMPTASTLTGTRVWIVDNVLARSLGIASHNYIPLNYEEFVEYPRETLKRLVDKISPHSANALKCFLRDDLVDLDVAHTVSGNPVRFKTGALHITPDIEWLSAMPMWKKLVVSALTRPIRAIFRF